MKIAHISVTDWAGSVNGMTLEEEGFFWRMTRLMYAHNGVFYDDDRENARLMNVGIRVYRRLKDRLMCDGHSRKPVIYAHDGRLVNDRVVEEINKFCEAKKAASDRGRAGAESRWGKTKLPASLPEVSSKFAPSLPEVSPKLAENSPLESSIINDLDIATPYSILHTPQKALFKGGKTKAQQEMAEALTGHHDVSWDPDARLQVANGFRSELLSQVGGDEIRLRQALDQAAGYITPHTIGLDLKRAVRAQFARQQSIRTERAAERGVSKPPRNPGGRDVTVAMFEESRRRRDMIENLGK